MTQPIQQLARSNTMPSRSRTPPRTRHSIGACDTASIPRFSEETLYTHPSVKIVKFELPQSASSKPILPDLDYPVDAIETLPWKVSTERIVSLRALKIENIASTTFLKAGSVIQALLRNCQGWCVDGKSIFVLRIRKLTYYRIELPDETEQDKERVERFKEVLSTIIRYEVTPCPFQRGFSIELPPEAKTPKRKKAWTPKHSPNSRMKKLELGYRDVDGGERDTSDLGSIGEESDHSLSQTSGTNISRPSSPGAQLLSPISIPRRVTSGPNISRPSSSGAQLSSPISIPRRRTSGPVTTEPLKPVGFLVAQFQDASSSASEVDDTNLSSSVDSFHSFQNSPSPPLHYRSYSTPPSPSRSYFMEEEPHTPPVRGHSRDLSEVTVTAEPLFLSKLEPCAPLIPNQPASPGSRSDEVPLSNPTTDVIRAKDSNITVRRRLRASRKRELSPPPPSSTLLIPPPRSPGNSLTTGVLQKTCTLVLGPPIQLLLMILRLASRIAAKDKDYDYIRKTNGEADETWDEDDFGMPISPGSSRKPLDYTPSPSEID